LFWCNGSGTNSPSGAATISVGSVGLSADVVSAFNGKVAASAGIENLITNPDWANKVWHENFAGMKPFGREALSELV
jgi:hypothetical protein